MSGSNPREELLSRVMAHVRAHGVSDTSLRALADAIGTSHRMLLYHFGSREGLMVEVIRAVEAEERAFVARLTPGRDDVETMRRLWRHFTDPAGAPNQRLFFEIYGQALQGRAGATPLLDGIVESWVAPIAAHARRRGLRVARARAEARLAVAVVRGLLLDLLATGDRAGVNAAFERYLAAHVARR